MKQLLKMASALCVVTLLMISCDKTGKDDGKDAVETLSLDLTYVSEGTFEIDFVATKYTETVEYAIAPAAYMTRDEVIAAFNEGSLDIESVKPEKVTIARDSIGPYAVVARSISKFDNQSEVAYAQIMPTAGGATIGTFDLIGMDYTVAVNDDAVAGVALMAVSKSVLHDMNLKIEDVAMSYAPTLTPLADGESSVVELNGYENYDFLIAVISYNAAKEAVGVTSFSFTSGAKDESLPLPGALSIEVKDIHDTDYTTVYTMGENTRAYYQMVITEEGYEEMIETGKTLVGYGQYKTPEEYIVDYMAFAGTCMFEDETHTWPKAPSGTKMVALGLPMNGNGSFGYGERVTVKFSTTGTPAESVAYAPVAGRNVCRPIVSAEQLSAFLNR